MSKHLHIISFAVPFPIVHGGMVDLFYKIVSLWEAGVKIYLHCFNDGLYEASVLNRYCESVYYYKRKKGIFSLSLSIPYIVSSRKDKLLVKRLLQDDYPILVEGIHSSSLFSDSRFEKRKLMLRLHNVEHIYYKQLFYSSTSLKDKIYYFAESFLLKSYEKKNAQKPDIVFTVSEKDKRIYRDCLGCRQATWLPVFTGYTNASVSEEIGNYCLYHGNLGVEENNKAVLWLLDHIFNDLGIPLVIAGNHPNRQLRKKVEKLSDVTLIENPDNHQLEELILHAQCNVLPSFNDTGVKLKLIHSLFNGRHCIVNPSCVRESVLADLCVVAESAEEYKKLVKQYFCTLFKKEEIRNRQKILDSIFNNQKNAAEIIRWL